EVGNALQHDGSRRARLPACRPQMGVALALLRQGYRMRIAQVSPLYERAPPRAYGGTERVVSFLTEELVRAGHDVTLFASGDSRTSAHLVPITEHALRLDSDSTDSLANHVLMLEYVMRDVDAF